MNDDILVNEAVAFSTAEQLADPVTRNLVLLAIAEARMRVIRRVGQNDDDWRAGLPEQPFDMQFFAHVLASMFAKADIIKAVLNGESLAEASGWDT
jgi:hypothetical protein